MHISKFPKGKRAFFPFFGIALFAASAPTLAADGVWEINQACVATGCFSGDDGGFPVTISNAGSYVLTSNLSVRDAFNPENVTAIIVDVTDAEEGVVIDLNGFRIVGPNSCNSTPVTSCDAPGSGIGIDSSDLKVTVRNGTVWGMGDDGVQLSSRAVVENMRVEDCAGDGIQVGEGSRVINTSSNRNGGIGISTANRSLVADNMVNGNQGLGMDLGAGTGYSNNVITRNGAGTVVGGLQMGANVCDLVLCP